MVVSLERSTQGPSYAVPRVGSASPSRVTLDRGQEQRPSSDAGREPSPPQPPQPPRAPPTPARPAVEDETFADFLNPQKKMPEQPKYGDLLGNNDDDDDVIEEVIEEEVDLPPSPHYNYGAPPVKPKPPFATLEEEKQDIIMKLYIHKKRGRDVRAGFTQASDIFDMRTELSKVEYELSLDESLSSYRDALGTVSFVTEMANARWDPFDLQLEGFSSHVMQNQKRFDRVFLRIHERYRNKMEMHPLVELVMTFGGMALMYHVSKKLANTFPVEGISSMLQERPDLMQGLMTDFLKHQKQGPPPAQATRPQPQAQAQQPQAQPQAQQPQTQQQARAQAQAQGRREMQGPGAGPMLSMMNAGPLGALLRTANQGSVGLGPQDLMPPPMPIVFMEPPQDTRPQEQVHIEQLPAHAASEADPEDDRLSNVASEDLASIPEDELASVDSNPRDRLRTVQVRAPQARKKTAKKGKKMLVL